MACGACNKRREARRLAATKEVPIKGDREHLTTAQINARLENYKRKFCTKCAQRYDCDYTMYVACKQK